ncbi:hypothetical protein GCM10010841_08890 [Deinococcus aerophilus]|uniref:TniQ domain-containing protein n=2 Tax=Deinococcus aerophilus TaxID=522488 RepID=A0ABQ2GLU5_9DEIO|nr:hypothetical protein GCM10010841_08890 [Deinococcus aerophilus]
MGNEHTLQWMLENCDFDLKALRYRSLTTAETDVLAVAAGKSSSSLQSLQLQQGLEAGLTLVVNSNATPFLGVTTFQVCPACLGEDHVPYVRRAWLYRASVVCKLHQIRLVGVCPGCRSSLSLPGVRTKRLPNVRRPDRQGRLENDLRRCAMCSFDLAQAPHETLAMPGLLTLIHEARSSGHAPEAWTAFVDAFFRASITYGSHLPAAASRPAPTVPGGRRRPMKVQAETRVSAWEYTSSVLRSPAGPIAGLRQAGQHVLLRSAGQKKLPRGGQLYELWLAQRLVEDDPPTLLNGWPGLVEALDRLLVDDPRVFVPGEVFRLTDHQWQLVWDDLLQVTAAHSAAALRRSFEGTLSYIAGMDWKSMSVPQGGSNQRRRLWREKGVLGPLLQALHDDLTQGLRGRVAAPGYALFNPSPQAPWRHVTARMLYSNGIIEEARLINPALHHRLVMELAAAIQAQQAVSR